MFALESPEHCNKFLLWTLLPLCDLCEVLTASRRRLCTSIPRTVSETPPSVDLRSEAATRVGGNGSNAWKSEQLTWARQLPQIGFGACSGGQYIDARSHERRKAYRISVGDCANKILTAGSGCLVLGFFRRLCRRRNIRTALVETS